MKSIQYRPKLDMADSNQEEELTRLALEELQKEAVRGKERSNTMGVAGWMKPKMTPNKRFLKNMLSGAVRQRERDARTIDERGYRQSGRASSFAHNKGNIQKTSQNDRHSKTKNCSRPVQRSSVNKGAGQSNGLKRPTEDERTTSQTKKRKSSASESAKR